MADTETAEAPATDEGNGRRSRRAKSGSVQAAKDLRSAAAPAKGSGRWATIFKAENAKTGDSWDEVVNISQMEPPGIPPEVAPDEENEDKYSVEEVGGGVVIGMRRGGEWLPDGYQKVQGFGWRDMEDYNARGAPAGVGAARIADMK